MIRFLYQTSHERNWTSEVGKNVLTTDKKKMHVWKFLFLLSHYMNLWVNRGFFVLKEMFPRYFNLLQVWTFNRKVITTKSRIHGTYKLYCSLCLYQFCETAWNVPCLQIFWKYQLFGTNQQLIKSFLDRKYLCH